MGKRERVNADDSSVLRRVTSSSRLNIKVRETQSTKKEKLTVVGPTVGFDALLHKHPPLFSIFKMNPVAELWRKHLNGVCCFFTHFYTVADFIVIFVV